MAFTVLRRTMTAGNMFWYLGCNKSHSSHCKKQTSERSYQKWTSGAYRSNSAKQVEILLLLLLEAGTVHHIEQF